MNKNQPLPIKDNILFRQWLNGTREIVQDTIFHSRLETSKANIFLKRSFFEKDAHAYYFSQYKTKNVFFKENPVSYMRNKCADNILKKLKQGKYYPDIFLDLHGLNQYQATQELGNLILTCQKEKFFCAHIMHGHGKKILKQQIPFWLSQHPDIIAFHQAPKIFGSDAAIIVIIEIHDRME